VAGAAKMSYARYVAFDICGGILWVGAMILGGYALGHSVPNIGARIHYVIAVVIVVSVLPVIISVLRSRRSPSIPGVEGK
jgi:membrane-associated protein